MRGGWGGGGERVRLPGQIISQQRLALSQAGSELSSRLDSVSGGHSFPGRQRRQLHCYYGVRNESALSCALDVVTHVDPCNVCEVM